MREIEGHAHDEGSGAGVDMVARMQHSCTTGASLTATLSRKCFVVRHLHKLVLMQHDMQRAWLLVRPAFPCIRMPHHGNGSDGQSGGNPVSIIAQCPIVDNQQILHVGLELLLRKLYCLLCLCSPSPSKRAVPLWPNDRTDGSVSETVMRRCRCT